MLDDYFRDGGGYRFDMKSILLGGPIVERYNRVSKLWGVTQEVGGRTFEGLGDSSVAAVLDLIEQRMEAFPPHRPRRGSDVEAWLKAKRDEYFRDGDPFERQSWAAMDSLLDDYRLHADTGASLDTPTEEIGPPNA